MFRLTRLNLRDTIVTATGSPTTWFQRWWQTVCEMIEGAVSGLQQALIDIQAAQDAADAAQTTADGKQDHDADLDTIAGQTNAAFGLSLLMEASATHLLGTTLNAYTKTQTDAAIAAAFAALNPITAGTASAGQTTITLNKAMTAGSEAEAAVYVGGSLQDASQYTFNGTTTATLGFAMAAGDRWRVLNFG